jgi:hypothetical protein
MQNNGKTRHQKEAEEACLARSTDPHRSTID